MFELFGDYDQNAVHLLFEDVLLQKSNDQRTSHHPTTKIQESVLTPALGYRANLRWEWTTWALGIQHIG